MTQGTAAREVLAGRAGELAELCDHLGRACRGTGRLVLLAGPPGIGKSRLAEELAVTAAATGTPVVWGRATDDDGAPSLWLWEAVWQNLPGGRAVRTLAGLDRSTGNAGTSGARGGSEARAEDVAAARFRLGVATTEALGAAAGADGLLVVLDDLQWADDASLLLLRQVVAELDHCRILIVGTHREEGRRPWSRLRPDLVGRSQVDTIRLEELTGADVAGYLAGRLGGALDSRTADAVHRHAGGNPLYLRTLARVLGDRAPSSRGESAAELLSASPELRWLVASQLVGLDPAARQVLEAASVAGEELDLALLAQVCELSEDGVLEAIAAGVARGVLRPPPDPGRGIRFVHALIRDAIYAGIDPGARAQRHRRTAEALQARAQRDATYAGAVAANYLRAGSDPETSGRAAHWAEVAALGASGALGFERAAELLTAALAAIDRVGSDDVTRARLLVDLATAEYRAGAVPDSLAHCLDAADLAVRARRPDLLAAAALVIQDVNHPPVATALRRLCRQALDDGPELPPATRSRLFAQLSGALAEGDQGAEAVAASASAVAIAHACGDSQAEFDAIRSRMQGLVSPTDLPERLRLGDRASAIAPLLPHPLAALWGPKWRLDAALHLGAMEVVEVELARIGELADRTRLPLVRWHHLRALAVLTSLRGEFIAARDHSAQATAIARSLGDHSAYGMGYAFDLFLATLRADPSDLPADIIDALGARSRIQVIRVSLVSALLLLGQVEEARARYEVERGLEIPSVLDGRFLGSATLLADLAVDFDDADTAARLYSAFLPFGADDGSGSSTTFSLGSTSRMLGRLAATMGRAEDAVRHLRHAVAADRRTGARPFAALSRLDLATVLLTTGELAEARTLAQQAAGEFRRLDMPGRLDRADTLLRRLDVAARTADPLTARERQIAGLVGAALTNRQIAERLFLSERTVETHVRNILNKLGFTTRAQVVAWTLGRPGQR